MYFTASFDIQGVVFITILLAALSHALPVDTTTKLPAKRRCRDEGPPPCICSNSRSIRDVNVGLHCGGFGLQFADPNSGSNGTLILTINNPGPRALDCDHIVELQFVATEIDASPSICSAFSANPTLFKPFFQVLNGGANVIFVEATINNVKGSLLAGRTLQQASVKDANGVISYLDALLKEKNYPSVAVADQIDTDLTTLVGIGNGFKPGFGTRYRAAFQAAITSTQSILHTLPNAPTPGDPFINLHPSHFQPQPRRIHPNRGIINPRNATPTAGADTGVITPIVDGKPLVPQPPPLGPPPNITFPIAAANSTSSITSAHARISSASVRSSGAAAPTTAHSTALKSSVKGSAIRAPVVPTAAKPPVAAP